MGGTRVTHWHFDDFLFSFILFCSTKLRHLSLHGTQNGRYSDIGNRKKKIEWKLTTLQRKNGSKTCGYVLAVDIDDFRRQ